MAYGAGLVPRSHVIRWASEIVEHDNPPDPAILEIATASRVDDSELHDLLDAVSGIPNPSQVGVLVLNALAERWAHRTLSVAEVAGALYALTQQDRCAFSEEERATMLRLDDAFELAASGVHDDVPSVSGEIEAFLARYRSSP